MKDNWFNDIKNEIDGIIGEGVAATYNQELEMWIGSLNQINYSEGYWIKLIPDTQITFNMLGFPYDDNIIYNLDEGFNLISYIGQDELSLDDAVPEEFLDNITAIIGEGVAASPNPNGSGEWVGSLNALNFGDGYWVKAISSTDFYWEQGIENNFILKKSN